MVAAGVMGFPARSSQMPSRKPLVRTTSVSPSHAPIEYTVVGRLRIHREWSAIREDLPICDLPFGQDHHDTRNLNDFLDERRRVILDDAHRLTVGAWIVDSSFAADAL